MNGIHRSREEWWSRNCLSLIQPVESIEAGLPPNAPIWHVAIVLSRKTTLHLSISGYLCLGGLLGNGWLVSSFEGVDFAAPIVGGVSRCDVVLLVRSNGGGTKPLCLFCDDGSFEGRSCPATAVEDPVGRTSWWCRRTIWTCRVNHMKTPMNATVTIRHRNNFRSARIGDSYSISVNTSTTWMGSTMLLLLLASWSRWRSLSCLHSCWLCIWARS